MQPAIFAGISYTGIRRLKVDSVLGWRGMLEYVSSSEDVGTFDVAI
jgi:hypothetical protein